MGYSSVDMALGRLYAFVVADRLARIVGPEKMSNARLVYSKVTKWNSDLLIRGAYSFGKIGMPFSCTYCAMPAS